MPRHALKDERGRFTTIEKLKLEAPRYEELLEGRFSREEINEHLKTLNYQSPIDKARLDERMKLRRAFNRWYGVWVGGTCAAILIEYWLITGLLQK